MNQCGLACHTIELVNDTINVSSGIDWIAVIALIVSLITFKLQWNDRKKDRKEQQLLREKDKQEQQNRIKKEDEIRRWNALYPYRLKFASEFFDVLYRFLNYMPIVEKDGFSTVSYRIDKKTINTVELCDYCSSFNRFAEDSKILFDDTISKEVCAVFEIIQDFIQKPFTESDTTVRELDEEVSSLGRTGGIFMELEPSLNQTKDKIKNLGLDTKLKEQIRKVMKLEGNKDE